MKFYKIAGLLTSLCLMVLTAFAQSPKPNLLVFSKTAAFRHESIEAGKKALSKMGAEKGFTATFSENSDLFTEANLKKYNAIVFLNTTGDILNNDQQIAFERYIQAGGGYVGIHAATDTEYDWPWYGMMAGAYFLSHPSTPSNVQKGKFTVAMKDHWATKGMPDQFERTDEFYSYKNISPKINVLLTLDDKSFTGGANPDFHPISWFQDFDGGRSFYTGMGHTDETFTEPLFLNHLWAGIQYAAGGTNPKALDFTKSRPEENRFSKVVLAEKLDEPMELSVLNDGRVLFIQRKGEVRLYNSKTKELKTIAKIPVSVKYVSKEGKESMGEDGLLGLSKDPDFAKNNWIYLYYSDPKESKNVLARFDLKGDELVMDSKKVMLDIPLLPGIRQGICICLREIIPIRTDPMVSAQVTSGKVAAPGMPRNLPPTPTICAVKSSVSNRRLTELIPFLKAIYLQKGQRRQDLKFIRWDTVTLSVSR
jgi:cytochrome c